MAQRFGGKFSPPPSSAPSGNGNTPPARPSGEFQGARRSRAGARVNMLFLVPLPLGIRAFAGDASAMALNLIALGLLLLAAWLTREGILAQEAYEARKIARRPAVPRKIFGSVITGLGLFTAAFAAGAFGAGLIYAALGAVLHFFAFGPDPLKNKGMEGVDTFQTDRVARAVGEAEAHLKAMTEAAARAGDRTVNARVDAFAQTARSLFRTVEDDPRDLTAARKYLGIYLKGARDAAVKFAELYSRDRSPEARRDFEALLDDLESNFSARTQMLLSDDRADLNVEIEVLRERLQRDGLRADNLE